MKNSNISGPHLRLLDFSSLPFLERYVFLDDSSLGGRDRGLVGVSSRGVNLGWGGSPGPADTDVR